MEYNIDNAKYNIKEYVERQIFPFTLQHITYFICITVITYYITDYFLQFKLFKWIYVGTVIVLGVTIFTQIHNIIKRSCK